MAVKDFVADAIEAEEPNDQQAGIVDSLVKAIRRGVIFESTTFDLRGRSREAAVDAAVDAKALPEGSALVIPKRYAQPGRVRRGDAPLIAEGF